MSFNNCSYHLYHISGALLKTPRHLIVDATFSVRKAEQCLPNFSPMEYSEPKKVRRVPFGVSNILFRYQ